jgi:lipopolysaccharide export system protein LptA
MAFSPAEGGSVKRHGSDIEVPFEARGETRQVWRSPHKIFPKPHTLYPIPLLIPLLALALSFLLPLMPVHADTFTFKADRMTGGRAAGKEVTVLEGNAEVKSDNLVLRATRIELLGDDNQFVECYGNVWGNEEVKDIYFKTDKMDYDRKNKVARLEGNSTMEDRKNEIVTRGRYIEYDEQAEVAIFQISVRLFKDNMVCRSEYAIYRRMEKLLDLSGFPVVYKKSDEFRADRIRVDLETDDVTMEGSVSGAIRN